MSASPPLQSIGDFHQLMGQTFALRNGGPTALEVRLSEVRSLGFIRPADAGGRESFALLFHAPTKARIPQGTYAFTHPQLGELAIFVVPLGPDAHGMRLEAIFNFA